MRIPITVLAFALPVLASNAWAQSSSVPHDVRKEGGKTCMSEHAHQGQGVGLTKSAARAAAVKAWIEFTNWEYGSAWASFGRSASQTTRYVKEATGWSAIVEGRPCKG
jgi:hypothetical protein